MIHQGALGKFCEAIKSLEKMSEISRDNMQWARPQCYAALTRPDKSIFDSSLALRPAVSDAEVLSDYLSSDSCRFQDEMSEVRNTEILRRLYEQHDIPVPVKDDGDYEVLTWRWRLVVRNGIRRRQSSRGTQD